MHTLETAFSEFKKLLPFQKVVLLSQPVNNGQGIPIIYEKQKRNNSYIMTDIN